MKLQTKLLALFLPLALTAGALVILLTRRAVHAVMVQEVVDRGLGEAAGLAQSILPGLRSGSERTLLPLLERFKNSHGVLYAAVLDPDGRVLAHTNVLEKGKVYADPLSAEGLRSDAPVSRLEPDGPSVDLAYPVFESEEDFLLSGGKDFKKKRLGTLRLGLPARDAARSEGEITRRVLAIVGATAFLSLLAAVVLLRLILRPIRALARGTRDIAGGRYGILVPVPSRDELGELARSFNRMSEALARTTVSKKHLDTILESMLDALLVIREDGTVRTVNRAAVRLLGYRPDELEGRPADALLREADRPALRQLLERALKRGAVESVDLIFFARDGRPVPVLFSLSQLRSEEGLVEGLIGVAKDMTERRAVESALRQSEAQLRQAQKMEAVGRLAGGVAHDFNNLLTAITGYADLILGAMGLKNPARPDVEQIKRAAMGASAMTRQLLAFSRKQVLQPRILDLNQVVGDMHKLLRRLIGEDVELVHVKGPSLGRVQADPGQIEQVLMNLAVNARDAMPQGGRLTIETANADLDEAFARAHVGVVPGPYVLLSVTDTGLGMDAETQSHLFEPFFTTKERGRGTGLGLSTVYGVVQQSGGTIWAESAPGKGACFRIYLPRTDVKVGEAVREEAPGPVHGTETVLLVEDEEAVRSSVLRILKRNGYTVLEAKDGTEALDVSKGRLERIDLLLTDVVMPAMSGPELAEKLRPEMPKMKVLFMSGYADTSVVDRAALHHGAGFIQKPFTALSLARKIRELLDGPANGKA